MEVISIIVPIYNVEKYLKRCLESLLAQSYPALEIILINDGSKDGSLEICYEYAKRNSHIKVIDKKNEGVSIARNRGIEAATGQYIGFIDPDDWVEPNAYEALYHHIKKWAAPLCLCNYYKDTKKKSSAKCFNFKDEVLKDKEIITKLVNDMVGMPDLLPKYICVMGCVWRGLFKTEFIKQHQLRFEPGVSIMEDLVFMVQALLKCSTVAIDQGVRYHYVQNPNSTLHSYNKRLWEDQLKVYALLEKSLIEAQIEEEMRNRLDFRYIGMVLTAIKNETYLKKNSDLKDTVAHIKQICQDEQLKFVLERVKPIKMPELIKSNKEHDKSGMKKNDHTTNKKKPTKLIQDNRAMKTTKNKGAIKALKSYRKEVIE